MESILNQDVLDELSSSRKKEDDVLRRTITVNGIYNSCKDESVKLPLKNTFSIDIDSGTVTNQRKSGRCWMFAGLNVIRTILFSKLNVKNIELSQAYLQFYDKLEKANFFFERAIENIDRCYDDPYSIFLLDSAISDGGHFVMFTNLVEKYGVVPSEEMPDLAISQDTGELNTVLSHLLSQGMRDLHTQYEKTKDKKDLLVIKEKYLKDVYHILSLSLGKPVKSFQYEYTDKDNKHVVLKKMTPKEFYETYLAKDMEEYVCLSNTPLPGYEDYTKYTSHFVNNVEGGSPVVFFNVPLKDLKASTIASLKDKTPVWFAADVLSQSVRKEGYLASGIYRPEELFSYSYNMDKKDRLTYRSSFCNHAMTFTGVNLNKKDVPDRWKVENSWGKDNGKDGYFIMSDKWFDDFVYVVFLQKKYIQKDILEKWEKAKTVEVSPFNTIFENLD